MNPLTVEWIEKADGDFQTAGREFRARKSPNYDAVCFHAQQCAEKYLKAFLQETQRNIPKTHSLAELLALCIAEDATIRLLQPDLNILEGYAIQFRYPGNSASKPEARSAYQAAITVRNFMRNLLI